MFQSFRESTARTPVSGFSLIELAVVIAIIAILSGVLIPMIGSEIDDARVSRALTDMKTLASAFSEYRANTGTWPSNNSSKVTAASQDQLRQFTCLYANTFSKPGWKGPYLTAGVKLEASTRVAGSGPGQGLLDPWSNAYNVWYFPPNGGMGAGGGVVIVSNGPNGIADSGQSQVQSGVAAGDDIFFVVTRRL